MQELVNVTSQTPLEVVLGIDKDGMTTGKKTLFFSWNGQQKLLQMVQEQHYRERICRRKR